MTVVTGALAQRSETESRNGRFSTVSNSKVRQKDMDNHETRISLLENNVDSIKKHLEMMTIQISKLNENIQSMKILIAIAVALAAPDGIKAALGLLK